MATGKRKGERELKEQMMEEGGKLVAVKDDKR